MIEVRLAGWRIYNGAMSSPTASNYVLGQSVHEYERLMLQARILRPYTEKFFRAAGLAPGMRVLDVGSGMGDVALLSADIVGPGGQRPRYRPRRHRSRQRPPPHRRAGLLLVGRVPSQRP